MTLLEGNRLYRHNDCAGVISLIYGNMREKPYYKYLVLAIVASGTFMATLDSSIVNVALPTISKEFHVGLTVLQWVVTAYLLTISSLLMAFGRMADILGKNRVYAVGFLGFITGSALCGIATSEWQLVSFRVIQAVGAAMLMANGMGLVTSVFPARERGRALGLGGSMVAAGSLTGPSLGGILVNTLGWRSIFYINIPIGIIGFLAAILLLPKDKDIAANQSFDFAGALLFAGSITSVLLSLSEGQRLGWTSVSVLVLAGLAVVCTALFFFVEAKVSQPMIDLTLFKNRLFLAGNVAGLISFVTMFFALFLMPFYLDKVLMLKPYQIGLMMTPFPLAMLVVAPVSGWASDRFGPLYLTTCGLAMVTVGLASLSTIGINTPLWAVAVRTGIMGIGAGMFQSPNNSSVMGTVPLHKLGVAGGVVATVRNVGMVIGVALSVTFFNTRYEVLHRILPEKSAFVQSISFVFLTAAMINLLGIVISAVRGRPAQPERGLVKR